MKANQPLKKNMKGRSQLKWLLFLLTLSLIILQLYSLLFKLPFDASMSNKKMGFFNLYLYTLTQSFSLWIPLLEFVLAQILLQFLLTLFVYVCAINTCRFLRTCKHVLLIGMILWISVQLAILLWNAILFPYSYYALALGSILESTLGLFIAVTLLIVSTGIVATAFIFTLIQNFKYHAKLTTALVVAALLLFSLGYFSQLIQLPQKNPSNQANVILIITDSLRPDYVNLKVNNQYLLPHLHELLKNSVFFPNAFTNLGRSTPGLVTMLTGKYPKNNGARFNLIETKELSLHDSLTHLLSNNGYKTILFADSLQFINVSAKDYGFDKVFAPQHGIYDFIFTFANDLPLSNLLMNTLIGELLFPYNYINRVAYHTYLPNTFARFFARHLHYLNINKPAFILIDLTLPHWPYVWARQPKLGTLPYRYLDSLKALDKQMSVIMRALQKKQLLEHAILVVASDHGDSFGLSGERYISEAKYIGPADRINYITQYPYAIPPKDAPNKIIGLDTSTGHGTDLLSASQLNTTLAFQFYGQTIQSHTVASRVALIDIAPTILDFLGLPVIPRADGISLKPLILNQASPEVFNNRPLFIESEIEIPTIDVTNKKQSRSTIRHLIDQYADLYYVNVNTQELVLRPEAVNRLLKEKQRGVMQDGWLLVHFPGDNNTQSIIVNGTQQALDQCYYTYPITENLPQNKYICYLARPTLPYFVLVNLQTYEWQVLFEQDAQQNLIFRRLLSSLKSFYGKEM